MTNHNNLFTTAFSMILIVAGATFIDSCTHSTEDVSGIDTVCFESDILPIFQTNCAISGCHDTSSGEIKYIDYQSIMETVTPNEPNNSKAYESTIGTWGEFMPPLPRQPLSKEQRTLIYLWIEQGAKNTTCKK